MNSMQEITYSDRRQRVRFKREAGGLYMPSRELVMPSAECQPSIGVGRGSIDVSRKRKILPTALSGLHTWLDLSDSSARLITSGAYETVYDKSGNNNLVTNSNASKRMVLVAGARNGLDGGGGGGANPTGSYLLSNAFTSLPVYTIFAVYIPQASPIGAYYPCATSNSSGSSLYINAFDPDFYIVNAGTNHAFNTRCDFNAFQCQTIVCNGASSSFTQNGTTPIRISGTGQFTAAASQWVIGNVTSAVNTASPPTFLEFIAYNRALSATECYLIEGYLAAKWNLASSPDTFSRLWDFDASRGVTLAGSTVSDWADQSGTGLITSVSQANPTYQPTWVSNWRNGKPAISFTGNASPQVLTSSSFSPIAVPYTLFCVQEWEDTPETGTNVIVNVGNNVGVNDCFFVLFDTVFLFVRSGVDSYFYRSGVVSNSTPMSIGVTVSATGSSRYNGKKLSLASGSGASFSQSMRAVSIGAQSAALANPYSGKIARICAMSGALSADDFTRLAFWANREFSI